MELGNYFKLLYKRRFTLILIPLVAIVITYFLVRHQPDVFSSSAQIATGIVDQTQQTLSQEMLQESRVNQEFSNLIELIRSKRMLDQVSYLLMIHDLTSDTPFRKPSKLLLSLNNAARNHALNIYKDFYARQQPLSLFDPDQLGLYKLMSSMNYDDQSLLKVLTVYRTDNSDFIQVQCDSDNPQLTAFVVNTLCKEVIDHYNRIMKTNQQKTVNYLSSLLKAKQDSLAKRMDDLKNYKIQNHVFNLSEQARALYGEIADIETKLEQAKKDEVAYQAALKNIDAQFNPADRKYLESSMVKVNVNIVNTRAELATVNDKFLNTGDDRYRRERDSLINVLANEVNASSDKYINSPLVAKQNLITQKLTMQIQYDLSKNSITSLQRQLDMLNTRLHSLVPHEAVVQADENAITVASQEYLEVLQKYNQTTIESDFTSHLRQVDTAMPGQAQPSKKMLLVILSGIIVFVFCLAVFFVLFLIDTTIKNPRELANKTKSPVIGFLNIIPNQSIDLNQLWHSKTSGSDIGLFKNQLQSIRFEIDNELKGQKTLLVNSVIDGEGKTYLVMNLAYAYAAINKRVLVIDGNFVNPSITKLANPKTFIEDYLSGNIAEPGINAPNKITVLGNQGENNSLMEFASEEMIQQRMEALKRMFDIILVEAPALDHLNKSKEWIMFSDKVLTVFEAGHSFKDYQQLNLQYLNSLHEKFMGWVLNMVSKDQLVTPTKG